MIDKDNALQNLTELNKIFCAHNIRYWIQDGTLLGYYREKDFIAHDNDIDIGVRWSEFTREIMFDILNQGFVLDAVNGFIDNSLVISIRKREIPVDFYFYYTTSNGIYHSALLKKPYANGRFRVDYSYQNFDVKESTFLNCKCFVPENELYFIETKYGKNWNIPDAKWVSSVDPLNRTVTNITIKKKQSREEFNKWLEDK